MNVCAPLGAGDRIKNADQVNQCRGRAGGLLIVYLVMSVVADDLDDGDGDKHERINQCYRRSECERWQTLKINQHAEPPTNLSKFCYSQLQHGCRIDIGSGKTFHDSPRSRPFPPADQDILRKGRLSSTQPLKLLL